ncbi:hypothetical protein [Sphingosinicella sp.]|uniref:hypothetical protein n=1 Tax=Sphingosinicella sp. TaxID=1917971 RepID=UPI0040376CF6
MRGRVLAAIAALSMIGASTAASAQVAQHAGAPARAAEPVAEASELAGGGTTAWIIGAAVIALLILALAGLAGDQSDSP